MGVNSSHMHSLKILTFIVFRVCEMDRIYEITSISNEFLNVNFTTKFTQVSHLKNLCRIMGVLEYFTF